MNQDLKPRARRGTPRIILLSFDFGGEENWRLVFINVHELAHGLTHRCSMQNLTALVFVFRNCKSLGLLAGLDGSGNLVIIGRAVMQQD